MKPRLDVALLLLAVIVLGLIYLANAPHATSSEAPHAASQAETLRGTPLGTSRTNPTLLNPLDGSQLRAGVEDRSPAGGVPTPTGGVGTALLGGWATYFRACPDCAAAGPALRALIGDWRGRVVRVDGPDGRWVTVRLTDWCQCRDRHGLPTLIDLSEQAFSELAPLSQGIVRVSVEWPQVRPTLPPTDAADDRMRLEVRSDALYGGKP